MSSIVTVVRFSFGRRVDSSRALHRTSRRGKTTDVSFAVAGLVRAWNMDLGTGLVVPMDDRVPWLRRVRTSPEVRGFLSGEERAAAIYLLACRELSIDVVHSPEIQSVWSEFVALVEAHPHWLSEIRLDLREHGIGATAYTIALVHAATQMQDNLPSGFLMAASVARTKSTHA